MQEEAELQPCQPVINYAAFSDKTCSSKVERVCKKYKYKWCYLVDTADQGALVWQTKQNKGPNVNSKINRTLQVTNLSMFIWFCLLSGTVVILKMKL